MKVLFLLIINCLGLCLWAFMPAMAQGPPPENAPEFPTISVDKSETTPSDTVLATKDMMTLRDTIENGGVILKVIIVLAFLTLILAMYLLLTVTTRREAPSKLLKQVANQIRAGEFYEATKLCNGRHELMAKVLYSGLRVADQERYIIQEAMESEGERGATQLWQRVSYMNNVGAIAPLLGLLGTVWGMIGAFAAIALDNSQVKGLTMALNVSEAMITTAAGLLVAIPALLMYYYLRGRVIKVVALIESQASEFVELIMRYRNEEQ